VVGSVLLTFSLYMYEAQVRGMAGVVKWIEERDERFQDSRFKIFNLYKLNAPDLDP
jgi:hypothetical protein